MRRSEGVMMRGGSTKLSLFCTALLFLCMLACVMGAASAKTIYVPDDYAKIQWAVDNATAGDTIIIRDSAYTENVKVDKSLTIKSENGSANCIVEAASYDAVFHVTADNVNISGFTIKGGFYGIYLDHAENCYITNNNVSGNYYGIYLYDSSDNVVSSNNASGNNLGIHLEYSSDNVVSSNNASGNDWDGICLYDSSNNIVSSNNASGNGESGICLGCSSNNTVSSNNASGNIRGIYLYDSSDNVVSSNNASGNNLGIRLEYSSDNVVSSNNASENYHGIYLSDSSNNVIYLNNFIDNARNVYSFFSTNVWNSTLQMTYTYRGRTYTNYMGNYWSDYPKSDADGDGIGDAPYYIDGDADNYPLMQPKENYFLPAPTPTPTPTLTPTPMPTPTPIPAKIFDTGRPDNPYPSISGKFVGTIRTNKKIIATKLYTYACEGTGGHTEHAIICNKTWCAEAKWEGYKEDWMNISFNRTVVLMPYETYNITIVTGSYPQIHHTSTLQTENGWINCTEFIDANGKKYNDWIPAIKLW